MKHFGDINAIRRAEVEELQQVDGMNIKSAEAVYNFLENNLCKIEVVFCLYFIFSK